MLRKESERRLASTRGTVHVAIHGFGWFRLPKATGVINYVSTEPKSNQCNCVDVGQLATGLDSQ